jgi:transcriptional regulator with XRE-family HTH domain
MDRQVEQPQPAAPTAPTTPAKLQELAPGITLGELSRKSGIAAPHLSRILSGKRGLSLHAAVRIADALEKTLTEIVEALAA